MKLPDFHFKFHFGKKKKSPVRLMLIGFFLGFLVDFLHKRFKVSQETLWDLIDEIGREFKIEDINELVLSYSHLLERRIERDVDEAIEDYWKEEDKINLPPPVIPIFSEEKEGDTPLGGEMRIRAPWVDPAD